MALPTFDAAKHHVGLKDSGAGDFFGFMLEGGYTKQRQREQPSAPEFGGATDLIGQDPSLARWTQDSFVGGMYAYQWGRDDAMFADSTGWMSSPQSTSLVSCPPVVLKGALSAGGGVLRTMFMVGGTIYVVWTDVIKSFNIVSGATASLAASNEQFMAAEYDSNEQMIWVFCHDEVPGGRPFIRRVKTDLSLPAVDSIYLGPSGTNDHTMLNGTSYNRQLVCQIGRMIFAGTPPTRHDPAVNGTIQWRKVSRLPGRWKDSIPYNGLLYIMVNDGSFKTQLYAFDQDTIFPICEVPNNFYGRCMIEYGGRVYLGGTGTDVNGNELYAELYEVTGSSLRLLRTFAPETRNEFQGGITGEWPQSIDDMVIHEGMLWFGQRGKKLIAYDQTSDGFFGAAEIQDGDLITKKMVNGRGRIWMYCDADTDGIYRIAQNPDTPSAWNPTLVTSDFIYELAMKKRWSEIVVLTRFAPVTSIEYSVDSGENWTSVGALTTEQTNKVYYTTASLAGITPSRLIRFRIKVDDDAPSSGIIYHRELVAYTVSFSLLGTEKKAWTITINGSHFIETLDAEFEEATTQDYTPSEVRDQLWSWDDNKTPLVFKDVNGDEYNVKIESLRETQPVIGPSDGDEPEAHFALTLLEV